MPQSSVLSLAEFSAINIAAVEAELDQIISSNKSKIDVLTQLDDVSWANFSDPIQQMDMCLEDFFSPVSHLNAVKNSDELRDVYQACIAKLTAYGTELGQNSALQQQYKKLQDAAEFENYSAAQKQWIKKTLLDFHLSGVDLPPAEQERFKTIKNRLAELAQTYSNHVLDATAAWKRPATEAELKGLPDSALAMLKQQAQASEIDCEYLLSLDFPVYQAVITYADDRGIREEIYKAYMTKASESGPNAGEFDNSELMVEIVNLRQEMAAILSFDNYGERSLATKMANSVDEVTGFLEKLAHQAKPFAEQELQTLQSWSAENVGLEKVESWDFAYVSEKYRQAFYALNDEALREYFPLQKVLSGLFEIVGRLFNIQIEECDNFDRYHDDVAFYQIKRDGQIIAGFYLDLFARDKKRGGAWMADCRSRYIKADGEEELPIAFLTCNFRPASEGKPALLGHGEVTTLFHEFGHGLHHMLTTENIAGVSGIAGVEWDAVELPSQFLENWCWQAESIQLIAEHYETKEALPQAMLDAMLAAKNFNEGLMMLRQVEFSLFDMHLHCADRLADAGQIQAVLDVVRSEFAVISPPDYVRFQHAFSHIFAGGYAAGYFSYKWAEVLSADAFSAFEEHGLFDQKTGTAFLENILQVGSSRPAAESFKAFRGREPSTDALLRHAGLI
ncbi:MAG: M3 family metallopeptidase [Pseudomonadales bacterium]|nr:M3 family metallopeptidase [Pseudomonadales bacterium]